MKVEIKNGRAVFAPLTFENDINPETKKAGIRVYNKVVGALLEFIGFAKSVEGLGDENKPLFINKKSFKHWTERHHVLYPNVNVLSTEREIINAVVEIAQLDKAIKDDPNNLDALTKRSELYGRYGNFEQAFQDINTAIRNKPSEQLYYEKRCNLYRANYLFLDRNMHTGFGNPNAESLIRENLKNAIGDCDRIYSLGQEWNFTRHSIYETIPTEVLLRKAHFYILLKDYDSALRECDNFLADHKMSRDTTEHPEVLKLFEEISEKFP